MATQTSYARAGNWPVGSIFDYLINATLQAPNDTGSVARMPAMYKNGIGDLTKCLDWKSPNLTNVRDAAGIAVNTWDYIHCTYFPQTLESIRDGSMFPPMHTTGTVSDLCSNPSWQGGLYGKTNNEVIRYYGITTENLEKTGRFLFTNGGLDPTTSIGPLNFNPPPKLSPYRNASRVVLMPNVAHTEEEYSYLVEAKGMNPYNDKVGPSVLIWESGSLTPPG
jgi:hypothetical protein